jgi:hypothetical protein
MQRKYIIAFTLIVVALLLMVEPAYAGPGGFISKGLFKTMWGKVLLTALSIILLPLILYVFLRQYFAVKKNTKTLEKLSQINKNFMWSFLEKTVLNVYGRVHIAWHREDMEEVSSFVSDWYWQNQQLVILDEWKRNNLKNMCHLQSVESIKPLHLEITENENLEGSRIAFLICANVEDYLINRETGKVVFGRKGYQEEEKIWILELTNGKWLLDDIREGNMSLVFAKMANIIPENLPLPTKTKTTSTL